VKTCTKCGETKPLSDYYAQRDCRDGRRPDCKDCRRRAVNAYRIANDDAIRERKRLAYLADPAPTKARSQAWRDANRDAHTAYARAWYEAHRDEAATHTAKRKALKRQVEHKPYTRREIYDRDGGRCRLCGVELRFALNAFHIDHIVPLVLRGPDTPANVQLACPTCNRKKSANLSGQIHFAL
jgi:hypothetical protein